MNYFILNFPENAENIFEASLTAQYDEEVPARITKGDSPAGSSLP